LNWLKMSTLWPSAFSFGSSLFSSTILPDAEMSISAAVGTGAGGTAASAAWGKASRAKC
jgi:hypothetical protein